MGQLLLEAGKMSKIYNICFLLVVILLSSVPIFAQFEAGSVLGIVKDSSGDEHDKGHG
jgi:hypothetical protein